MKNLPACNLRVIGRYVSLVLLVFLSITAFAQQKTVSGRVTDSWGQGVASATVAARGSRAATQTNAEGRFTLSVPSNVTELTISSVGFRTETVRIGSGEISVSLLSSATQMSEVVVTALGVTRKQGRCNIPKPR